MLVLIIGENGSGKSLFMVLMALITLNKNILSNFYIKHPHYRKLEFDDFLHIKDNEDVYIDEAYKWLEKRRSNKASNVYISEIKEQKRKTNSTWYISEQRPNLLDLRFENFCNVIVHCKTRLPIGYSTEDFNWKIVYTHPYQVSYKTMSYEDAKKYFKYFDTNEIIEPENKQKIEFDIIKDNPDKLFKKVLELVKILESKHNGIKYTHDTLKYLLMENGIYEKYEKYIFWYFKEKKRRLELLKQKEKKEK